ncbi:serine O-acetyltransferase [Synechococcus sp. H55.2]|uniref:serine O-acetyltransferase n=1 Tax=unclassified Synechococcus TaxID=2626047 RepID=UPI0039C43E4B
MLTKANRVSETESSQPAVESSQTEASDALPSGKPEPKLGFWQQFWEDVDCVFERDPAARNRWEVIFTYPGVHALFLHRIAHWLWKRRWFFLARVISFFARSFTLIEIHPAAQIGRRFFIDHGCGVVIGETAEIGDDVTLYHGVTLGGTSWSKGKRHPTLENGVIVGTGAKILGPVRIGEKARIGANAVVIQDVAPGMTVVGIPGRAVIPPHQRRIPAHGIDLDHHLMPDPVGRAIEQLLHRIQDLEAQVARLNQEREKARQDEVGGGSEYS